MDRQSNDEYSVRCKNRINVLINEFCGGVQQVFAERTGIQKASVNQYVKGRNVPNNISARKIADAFAVNPSWVNGFPSEFKPLTRYPSETREALEQIINAIQDEEYDVVYDLETVSIYENGKLLMPFRIEDIIRIYKNAAAQNDTVTVQMLISNDYDTEGQKIEKKIKLIESGHYLSSALGVDCTEFIRDLSVLNKAGIEEIFKRAKELRYLPTYVNGKE